MTPMTNEHKIDLRVNLPEAQLILNALSDRSYRDVSQLVPNLMAQIQRQLKSEATPIKEEKKKLRFSAEQFFQQGAVLWQATRATDEAPYEGDNSPWVKVISNLEGKRVVPGPTTSQPDPVKKEA